MRTLNFKNSVIALAVGLAMLSCGGRGGNQQSGTTASEKATEQAGTIVKFVSAEELSVDGNGNARLVVVLDKATSLMTSDVTSNVGEVDMVQNSSGNGTHWRVTILKVAQTQEITITIKKSGYTFEPSSRTLTVQ